MIILPTIAARFRPVNYIYASLVLVALFFGWIVPAQAAGVLYVAPVATGSGDCSSWANACILQTALGMATGGDQVWVRGGVHKPGAVRSDSFTLKSGVHVYGGFAGTETQLEERDWASNLTVLSGDIDNNDAADPDGVVTDSADISGANSYHVVSAGSGVTETTILDGFVITAGLADGASPDDKGGGMINDGASPILSNLTFAGNKASSVGGGMFNVNANSLVLTNSSFSGNFASSGGGLYNSLSSSPSISHVTFSRNTAQNYGGGMHNDVSDPTVTMATFSENSAGIGGGLYNFYCSPVFNHVRIISNTAKSAGGGMYSYWLGNPALTNVALIGNSADIGGGGVFNDRSDLALTNVTIVGNTSQYGGGVRNIGGDFTLTNSIVWGNVATVESDQIDDGVGTLTISYSLIQDSGGSGDDWDDTLGTDGGGNIDADPLFVDSDGVDDLLGTFDDDLRLNSSSPAIDAGDNSAVPGSIVTDLNGAPRFIDDPYAPDTGNGGPPLVDMGAYEAAWVRYAAPAASGNGDCSTWADACTLETALNGSEVGSKIWAKDGLYKPGTPVTKEFGMKSGVQIYGGFAGTETQQDQRDWETNLTVLSGDIDNNDTTDANGIVTSVGDIVGNNSYHLVYAGPGITETAVLDGFVVTAGQAYSAGNDQFGGGLLVISSSPTVRNVLFIGNRAGYGGGGVYCGEGSTPTLMDVTISNCAAYIGGGMYSDDSSPILSGVLFDFNQASIAGAMRNAYGSNPILTDVVFSNNRTTNLSGDGGAMYNYFSNNPILNDVTFIDNVSRSNGGGIANRNSNPTLINVSFYGNSTRLRGGGIYNLNSNPLMVNVLFSGNTADGGGGMSNSASNPKLINATFCNNLATSAGGGILNADSTYTLTNVIVWGNSAPGSTDDVYSSRSSLTINNSIIGSPDPRFLDADGADDTAGTSDDDLRLLPDSPAVDAGDNAVVPITVTNDFSGLPRFIDIPFIADTGIGSAPIVDIGAHEAGFSGLALDKAVLPATVSPGDTLTFTLNLTNTGYITAVQVILLDSLPSFLQPGSVVTSGIIITDSGNPPSFAWDVEDLAPSDGGLVTITVGVTGPVPAGMYTNTATAAYGIYDITAIVTGSVVYTVANTAPFFTGTPVTAALEDTLYAYELEANDLNGDLLTITAPVLPGWLALTDHADGTASLAGTPGNQEVGDYALLLLVTDSGGLSDTQSFTLTVVNANDEPVFTSTPVTATTEDDPYTYEITAVDPDLIHGDVLTITAPTLPGWLGLTDHGEGTATLYGTPATADVGAHAVMLRLVDGGGVTDTQSFTLTVDYINDAPSFTSTPVTTATEDAAYTYGVSAVDPDMIHGDVMTITIPELPGWLNLTDHGDGTATLSGTPTITDVGDHGVLLHVVDSRGLTDTQTFTIAVAYINDAPAFTSEPVTIATEDTPYIYAVTAIDPDLVHGDALSITGPVLPGWLGLADHGNGTATLSGTPTNEGVGEYAVHLRIVDSGGLTDTQSFTLTVVNVNDAPAFTSVPSTQVTEDESYNYAIAAADPDLIHGDVLTITAPTLPGWLNLTDDGQGTGALFGTPTIGEVGNHGVLLRIIDSEGLTDTQAFTVSVAYINDVPVFASEPVVMAMEESPYTYTIAAADPDLIHGDALTITAPVLPGWLNLTDRGDGDASLSGTPALIDVGDHGVQLRVVDAGGLSGTQSFTITVDYINDAPAFVSTPVTGTIEDQLYAYVVEADDPDLIHGDALTITTPGLPGWLMLIDHGDGTGVLFGTPDNEEVGEYGLTLRVLDREGLTDTQTFSLTVTNVNDAPTFTSTPVITTRVDSSYTYFIAATDPDLIHDDELVFTAPTLPDWLSLSINGDGTTTLNGTPEEDDLGDHAVRLRVRDNQGASEEQAFTITVMEKYAFDIYLPLALRNAP